MKREASVGTRRQTPKAAQIHAAQTGREKSLCVQIAKASGKAR
jgi:hypothetical protein